MKCESDVDNYGSVNVTLIPETVEEASRLVRHALNASADARKVCDVDANNNGIVAQIYLHVRQDRFNSEHKMVERVLPQDKP